MIASVILLNWNSWQHTIECLESVLRMTGLEFRVVICDNASQDGSFDRIKAWARGEIEAPCANPQLSRLVSPPIEKPIPFCELTREEVDSGTPVGEERLILIQNGENLGFAGGCNVGLRHVLKDERCKYFWLLNNDTVVETDALIAMVRHMEERPEIGLCGSLNLSYYSPTEVQAQGGKSYSRWTARVPLYPVCTVEELPSKRPPPIDFVNGASMLASRNFLENVGLMEESYFLYFEELDWAARARDKFQLGYASQSVIYHKEGSSIGSNLNRNRRSILSDKYLTFSRVLFTKRFFPFALPSVLLFVCLAAIHRFLSGDPERARAMLAFMVRGLRSRI